MGWARRAKAPIIGGMMRKTGLLAPMSLALVCAACGHLTSAQLECHWPDSFVPPPPPNFADVSEVRAYRNYAAVTRVEPYGDRFTIWYRDVEPNIAYLRAERDRSGKLRLIPEGGWWGAFGVPSGRIGKTPPDKQALADEVLKTLRARCRHTPDFSIQYDGAHRVVTVYEFVPHQLHRPGGKPRLGWHVRSELMMDETLSRIQGVREEHSGFGVLRLPVDAQLLTDFRGPGSRLLFANQGVLGFSSTIGEAARRYLSGAQAPSLASVEGGDAALVPPGYVSRVDVAVNLYGNTQDGNRTDVHVLRAGLDLQPAVFGPGASARAEVSLGPSRYTLKATLVPDAPRSRVAGVTTGDYRGTLSIELSDDHGRSFRRAYPASGLIELERDTVVAPYGFTLPGASSPSPEAEALHVRLPASPPLLSVDVYVEVQLDFDARL